MIIAIIIVFIIVIKLQILLLLLKVSLTHMTCCPLKIIFMGIMKLSPGYSFSLFELSSSVTCSEMTS